MSLSFLERFAPASQELLRSRALLRRTDTKFILSRALLPQILGEVEEHYALLRTAGQPFASYQTRYFDTPDLACFHAHRRGRRVRFKVRFRHYHDRKKTYLEVKRRGTLGTDKVRRSRKFLDEELSSEDWEFLQKATGGNALTLQPGLCNAFHRIMLVGLERPERVTIDLDLSFSQQGRELAMKDLVIVEVKQAKLKNRSPLMMALRKAGVRPSSASKYCLGSMLLDPSLRRTRLGRVVKAVTKVEEL